MAAKKENGARIFILGAQGGYLFDYAILGAYTTKTKANNAWKKWKNKRRKEDYSGDGSRKIIIEAEINQIIEDEE